MHNLSCVIIISTISLAPIDKDVYVRFATKLGEDNGKQVEKTAIEDLNDLVDGYTYCFQRSMKTVFSLLPAEEAADRAFIFARIDELLTSNTEAFQDSLSGLPPNQRALLSAAAVEGRANTITSTEFIHRLGLGAVSSVQSAARSLLKRQLMTRDPQKQYYLDDKYLEL